MKLEPAAPMPLRDRTAWHLGANAPVAAWLVALFGIALVHRYVPESPWLLVHLLLLGAVTNAIFVWSAHFTDALLRRRTTTGSRRWQASRLVALNAGVATVVAGMVSAAWILTLVGSVVVGAAAAAHGIALTLQARTALPSRFGATVRYYICASLALPVGAGLGATLARDPAEPWHGRLVVAHITLNLLGWIGLTVLGTLVTLWPTMLRTRISEDAERVARQALPILVGSVVVTVAGALAGLQSLAAFGAAAYLGGVLWAVRPLAQVARTKAPSAYATWSVMAGVLWLVGSLLGLVTVLVSSPTWQLVAARLGLLVTPLAAGFAAQVLLGALSYLVPVVLGGGPTILRGTQARLERGNALRAMLINVGLVVCVLPVPSLVRVLVSMLVLGAFAAFLPLLGTAVLYALRGRRAARQSAADPPPVTRHAPEEPTAVRGRHTGLAAVAVALVVLAIAGGAALDPAALGTGVAATSNGVVATGQVTTVKVVASHMRFVPASVDVPTGNRLVLLVTNNDADVHDLALETGQNTGRITRGRTARLDIGVVGRDLSGWCTIVGHRALGMVFAVHAIGGGRNGSGVGASNGTMPHTGATAPASGHAGGGETSAGGGETSAAQDLDFMARPGAGFTARDATIPPLPPPTQRTHRVTMTVSEVDREVAVGVRQRLWTFNGTAPGPTLHGRVGDVFEVTLVNDGTIGHSIDFHAGALAPDVPMRTVEPGRSLSFRLTATHSGIWLYHCSSMPMSSHIANGMFGAVIIDPPGLAKVDREYVLEQSELYLGPQGGVVDAAKVAAEKPDAVVFNGFANQYDIAPLVARVGKRVRIWVLAAGPNRGTSFHVVGGQLDTVFSEGAWLLRPGNASSGGSQVLSLGVAQGGFVELSFPQAGHYPFVSHVMVDAERGAHGLFRVTP
ncbi:MAG: multicopper oxidase domain-containing protein [Dermatophilaceae bacterium]